MRISYETSPLQKIQAEVITIDNENYETSSLLKRQAEVTTIDNESDEKGPL